MDLLKKLMKFGFPALEVIIGIYLVTFSGQGQMFIIAGVAIIASGLLTGLFIANIIGKGLNIGLQAVILLLAAYFAYADFNSVDSEIRFARKKQKVDSETIQHLKDIRTAEIAFRETYRRYIADLDSLVDFVKNDSIIEIRAIGDKPDTLTTAEAISLGIITRDTFKVSVMNAKFVNISEAALKKRKYPFDPDQMIYAPYSGKMFLCLAGFIEVSGGIKRNVFEVMDPEPIAEPALKIGSMTESHTNGNWKE
jgi:hypothetical protein